jgi:outer membrane receptor for ferrienterochelin and colicins
MLGSEEERWRDAEGSSGVHEGVYDIDRLHMALAYRGDFGSSKLTVQAYRSWEDADYETTAGETSANRLIDEVVDAHGSFALGSSQLLTLGGEYRNEKLENALFAGGEEKATHKALFAQDEVEIGQSITVTAGVRWDEHDFFDAEVSPRLYAVYHATDTLNLKGGYGHGFKAPTLKQLSPEYVFRGPHTFYGNPDLQPEVSDSYELGAEYDGEGVSAKLIFFRNEIDDLIDTECIANCDARFGREFRYVNVDEAQTQGVEAELEAGLGRDLTLGLNYGYLDAEDMKSEERLEGRPRHSANARLTHRYAPWGLRTTIGYEYVGSQILNDEKAPGYSLWHLGFGKDLAKGLELRFGVDNLTDERLADEFPHFEYEERGRFFYAGLRAAF